ncbi:hypothetical protein [Natronococcus jeotgali]|uniref:hypothetical protein n=1 Tax=Natronococcus jeotgali TaxID=413812 RepID=UPI001268F028|nr:hypothetical protein [Natronococcus jeotgali]
MAPYQVVPGSRVTVVERDVGWRPQGIASHDRASVVRYDHAPSLRAILLTVAPLREDRSLALREPREAVSEANRPLVTVVSTLGSRAVPERGEPSTRRRRRLDGAVAQ